MFRAAAIAALLLATGCGAKPERAARTISTPTTTATSAPAVAATATPAPEITHTDLVKALNASCSSGQAKSKALRNQFEASMDRSDLQAAGRAYTQILPYMRAHAKRMEALPAAERAGDRAAMRRYLNAQRRLIGVGARITAALFANDLDRVESLVSPLQHEWDRRLTAAIDLGADKCGN